MYSYLKSIRLKPINDSFLVLYQDLLLLFFRVLRSLSHRLKSRTPWRYNHEKKKTIMKLKMT